MALSINVIPFISFSFIDTLQVYKAIVDIIKELGTSVCCWFVIFVCYSCNNLDFSFSFLAMQDILLPLCGSLPDQSQSLYQLLQILDQKVYCREDIKLQSESFTTFCYKLQANTLLQHICKAGNGSIPKTRSWGSPKNVSPSNKKSKHHKFKQHNKEKDGGEWSGVNGGHGSAVLYHSLTHGVAAGISPEPFISSTIMEKSAEERLARWGSIEPGGEALRDGSLF